MPDFLQFLTTSSLYSSAPVFFLYCLSVSYKLRKSNSWSKEEAHRNPIGCMVSILIVNFGGLILINGFVKGTGLASFFQSDLRVGIVLAAWSLVYFSPMDIVFNLLSIKPIKIALNVLLAWKRSRDVISGVLDANSAYQSLAVSVLLGLLSGWGGSLLFPYEAQLRFRTVHNDLQQPSISFLTTLFTVVFFAALCPAVGISGPSYVSQYFLALLDLFLGPKGRRNYPLVYIASNFMTVPKITGELSVIFITLVETVLCEFPMFELFHSKWISSPVIKKKISTIDPPKTSLRSSRRSASSDKKNK